MTKSLVIFLCFLVVAIAPAQAASSAPSILVLGDSLSAAYGIDPEDGWVALLANRLEAEGYPHRVVNASISGETTSGGRRRLPELLAAHRPSVVVIELGANDGLRGMPLPEIEKNFMAMIKATAEHDARTLVVRMQLPPNYGPEYTEGFNAIYDKLGALHGVALTPFLLSNVILEPTLMQADGLHPTAAAQSRLLETVWPSLKAQLNPVLAARR